MHLPKRIAAVFLTMALLVSTMGGAQARQTHQFDQWPETVDFDELTYDLSAGERFQAQCVQAEALAESAASEEAVLDCFLTLQAAYDDWNTQCTVCSIRYYQDAQTYGADYLTCSAHASRVSRAFLSAVQALLLSDHSAALWAELGADTAQSCLSQVLPTDSQLELEDADNELISDYWSAMGQSGSDAGTPDTGTAAGEVFLQMLPLRNEMALSYGYDTFPDFAYREIYCRDYTVADAEALHALVKEYILPLSVSYDTCRYTEMGEADLSRYDTADQGTVLDALEPCMDETSSELGDLFRYMRQSNLCDMEPSDTKLQVGFTMDLPAYRSAFFFIKPYGSYYDLKTAIHEFGHFSAFCFAPSVDLPIDVAEIHSQGLEMLFMPYAEELFPGQGQAFRATELSDLLSSITEGCLYNEFQIYAYSHPDVTLDELNEEFRTLALEYGYPDFPGLESYWVNVNHTFESPMYYLSYATSALSALDIFLRSQDDYEGAVDTYLNLISLSDGRGYRATVEAAGLTDLFQEENLSALTDELSTYLYTDLYGLQDLKGHWSLSEAGHLVALGVMKGDGSAFRPDEPMSRAMLVTTLYRLAGEPDTDAQKAIFDDVPTWTWYSNAVAWAYENGLIAGTGAGFDPAGPMTRESAAALLHRFAQLGELPGAPGDLSGFSDAGARSPWAAESVKWAVGSGILRGADGRLNPSGGISRAEAAVMLFRLLELKSASELPAA